MTRARYGQIGPPHGPRWMHRGLLGHLKIGDIRISLHATNSFSGHWKIFFPTTMTPAKCYLSITSQGASNFVLWGYQVLTAAQEITRSSAPQGQMASILHWATWKECLSHHELLILISKRVSSPSCYFHYSSIYLSHRHFSFVSVPNGRIDRHFDIFIGAGPSWLRLFSECRMVLFTRDLI